MAELELIGVPFDGYGRSGNLARASRVLRAAGFVDAFEMHRVIDAGDLDLPEPNADRALGSGLVNEGALIAMADALNDQVTRAVRGGRFPVVYGADCSTLLGSVTALRDAVGTSGLLFIDGHEDTMPLDVSEDGEAANTEIGLLLGLTGRFAPESLRARMPAIEPDALAMLGPRDEEWRRQFNVGSLRERGIWQRSVEEIAADPSKVAREAVAHLRVTAENWWLHVDLDVLNPDEFTSQGVPGVEDEPGGLSWQQLTDLAVTAAGMEGCRGWSVAIYDPDQDVNRTDAAKIVRFAREIGSVLT
ncbi:arginase family protein [Leifsonia sp. YAF41]|uniref:arginase family protein n=1 Tax=Leifsonia sp. YAF41 TaxID=3233086 RepID=UPI003F98EC01